MNEFQFQDSFVVGYFVCAIISSIMTGILLAFTRPNKFKLRSKPKIHSKDD